MQHSARKLIVFVVLLFSGAILITPCLFVYNSSAYASPTATTYLLVSPLTYVSNSLGETFKIDVNVFNVENLHTFEFKLSYNTTLLDVVQAIQGPFFPPPPESSIDRLEIDETEGSVWFGMSLSNSTPSKNGDGTLASITLNVTFAPVSPTKACCVFDLHETMLYDNTMTPIVHCITDGLYFWESMLDDPDGGVLLDLTTQKGGTGIGQPSPPFAPGEIVELRARLTYSNAPEVNNLVSFQVLDPNNGTVITRVQFTDHNGVATIEFRIPEPSISLESIGTWKAIAISEVKGTTVWDILRFVVKGPVGGYITPIEKTCLPTSKVCLNPFILQLFVIATLLAIIVYRRKQS